MFSTDFPWSFLYARHCEWAKYGARGKERRRGKDQNVKVINNNNNNNVNKHYNFDYSLLTERVKNQSLTCFKFLLKLSTAPYIDQLWSNVCNASGLSSKIHQCKLIYNGGCKTFINYQ